MNIIRVETGCDDGEIDSNDDESDNENNGNGFVSGDLSPMSTMDYNHDRNSSHLTMIGDINIATKKRRETNVMSEGGYENED